MMCRGNLSFLTLLNRWSCILLYFFTSLWIKLHPTPYLQNLYLYTIDIINSKLNHVIHQYLNMTHHLGPFMEWPQCGRQPQIRHQLHIKTRVILYRIRKPRIRIPLHWTFPPDCMERCMVTLHNSWQHVIDCGIVFLNLLQGSLRLLGFHVIRSISDCVYI